MNTTLALLGSFGLPEILVILLILVLIFGARKLPELGRGIGEGIKNFRTSMRAEDDSSSTENGDAAKPNDRRISS